MNASTLRVCLILILLTLQVTYGLEEEVDTWELVKSINDFGFHLQYWLTDHSDKNIVFSPLSVANTLAMVHFGARGGTAKELGRVLRYDQANLTRSTAARAYKYLLTEQIISPKPKDLQFDMANAIFIKSDLNLNPAYKRKVEEFYRSPVKHVDFSENATDAIAEINEMVREKTRNKIKNIIDKLDPAADVVSVNVAYFKGLWEDDFPADQIRKGIFYNKGHIKKTVTMMEQVNILYYAKNKEVSIVYLPFKSNNASMIILLPKKRNGLSELEEHMSLNVLFQYMLQLEAKQVQVIIPKFKFSYNCELSTTLQTLGAIQLFQPSTVNLAGMISDENVTIGEIKHKAIIEVNEFGVEAEAATIILSHIAPLGLDAIIKVNHPFMFLLLDRRSGIILFMGSVWEL